MTLSYLALLLAMGAFIGFAAGLLGIGGGMLMVPLMTLLLEASGFPVADAVKVAIATSLATIIFTSLSSMRAHHSHGAVLWPVVLRFTPGIVVGALVGAQLASAIAGGVLAALFSLFVGFSATQMLINRKPTPTRQLPGTAAMAGVGTGIGALSSLVGAGGAFVSVPFMVWCNVRVQNAVGTSAALALPVALAGTVGYMLAPTPTGALDGMVGMVYLPALVAVSVASVFTAPLGARMAHSMSTVRLKRIFALMLYSLSAYMLYRALA
jgi:uncharacterized protein